MLYHNLLLAGINIQSTSHDSIEDARTALKLYRKYKSMASEGIDPQAAIKEMYDKGRALQWKIPEDEGEQPQGAVINKDIVWFRGFLEPRRTFLICWFKAELRNCEL